MDKELLELFLKANSAPFEQHESLHEDLASKKTFQQSLENHKLQVREEQAKSKGWIVYPNEEAYEKQISPNSFVYLFLEDDGTYTAWRGTWREGSSPASEKVIVQKVNFVTAFWRANEYIKWFTKSQTKLIK